MQRTIYVDLRCLQDHNYRVRGIGHHLSALLRTRAQGSFANTKTVGLIQTQSPPLPREYSSLVDELSGSLNPCSNGETNVFIDGTPMTHDPRFSLRFVGNSAFLTAAVVYDFIPLDWPGYLPTAVSRIGYIAKLARLKNFDLFFPISEYTASRLAELCGVPGQRIRNTGASVRRSVYELRRRPEAAAKKEADPYFVTVLADDRRKNPKVIIEALQQLNSRYSRRIGLKVVGHYQDAYKRSLLNLAGREESDGFLEFCPEISDEGLVSLYRGAIATVVSSHIEGFSLPVVEASVCGSPVVASSCAAHLELIDQPEALFPSSDATALAGKLEALLNHPKLRSSLASSQASLGEKFHEDAVGQRFWDGMEAGVDRSSGSPTIRRRKKPSLAFLSPYPPDASDAAFYTAMTMEAGHDQFDSELYSDSARPLAFGAGFRDAGRINLAPLLSKKYNGIVSVLGNSPSHARIFEFFERFGGPCILHDVRLTQTQLLRLGTPGFLNSAAALLGRPVSTEEVSTWLHDANPPSLFLENILERASPLIVHTVTQQALLKKRYGVDAQVVTSCPSATFAEEELTPGARHAMTEHLGIASGVFAVSSFGDAKRATGMDTSIMAIEFLRSWRIPAELYFVGDSLAENAEIHRIANIYGVSKYVHSGTYAGSTAYRDFLIASDAAVQLRPYEFGKPSTVLSDCISAGLPCVATNDMVISCDAPSYARSVPDHPSPLHVAEQLAEIWESLRERDTLREERCTYLSTHNFHYYGLRLIEILGLA